MKLGVIGCGNMGRAIVQGIMQNNIFPSGSVCLNDAVNEKVEGLAKETGASVADIDQILDNCGIILIAVKPQDSELLLKKIGEGLSDQVLISVMAGMKIESILKAAGKEVPVARAMPNMAAFVGKSVTGLSFSDTVDESYRGLVKGIFSSIGTVVLIDEEQIDAVTALSGSGPAYLFYLAQAMIEAGVEMGIPAEKVKELVLGTLEGSSNMLMSKEEHPSELIDKVASKGGTTEAALNVLNDGKVADIIKEAIFRAKDRAEEISGG